MHGHRRKVRPMNYRFLCRFPGGKCLSASASARWSALAVGIVLAGAPGKAHALVPPRSAAARAKKAPTAAVLGQAPKRQPAAAPTLAQPHSTSAPALGAAPQITSPTLG